MRRPALTSAAVTGIFGALSAITPASVDMPLPSLPTLTQALSTTPNMTQLVIGLFMIGFGGAQIFYGPVSDRFGRRPVLLFGLSLYCLASLACIVAPSIEVLVGARLVQGAGACSAMVIARACVRDVHGRNMARVMAMVVMCMSLAPILAPIIGGFVLAVGSWRVIFMVLFGSGALLLLVVALWLDETATAKNPEATRLGPLMRTFGGLLAHRIFIGYASVVGCISGALFAMISDISFVMSDAIGASASTVGIGFATVMIGQILGALIAARSARRGHTVGASMFGVGFLTLGGVLLAALALARIVGFGTIIGPLAVMMFGFGQTMPVVSAGAMVPFGRTAGAASSLLGVMMWGAGATVGAVVVAFHDGTALPMGIAIAGLGALALLILRVVVQPAAEAMAHAAD
jgi:DHA1 family bicyclomycin/chloramphenicol resistance-like MFS transporter